MCGIFAVMGGQQVRSRAFSGLKRLEYRGYDSWGLAVLENGEFFIHKELGPVSRAVEKQSQEAQAALGHTRWATHGSVSTKNAHPHLSRDGSFLLVHNGLVENLESIREFLDTQLSIPQSSISKEQLSFPSDETDTAVIVRLIEYYRNQLRGLSESDSVREAFRKAFLQLEGRNGVVLLSRVTKQLLATRLGTPLVVGIGEGQFFLASDCLSFAHRTNKVTYLEDGELAELDAENFSLAQLSSGKALAVKTSEIDHQAVEIEKGKYPHFMIKEIFEQAEAVRQANAIAPQTTRVFTKLVREKKRLLCVGAGGAYFTAAQIAFYFRSIAGVAATAVQAAEFESYLELIRQGDPLLVVSQSGETADTIVALERAREAGARPAAILNMPGSSIERMSEMHIPSNAGPEIGVLSTKTATSQLASGYYLAMATNGWEQLAAKELGALSDLLEKYCSPELSGRALKLAEKNCERSGLFLIGSDHHYHLAQIASLNIKEASCLHAESFSAGEFKHGVLALVEPGTAVVVFLDRNSSEYVLAAVSELKARGAEILGISPNKLDLFDSFLPILETQSGLSASVSHLIPTQLFAYHLGVLRGHNPDRPRNLAKSITVK